MPAPVMTKEQQMFDQRMNAAAQSQVDPWMFLINFVYTHDEKADTKDPTDLPVKKFPEKAFYRIIVRMWEENDRLFLYKTRQIMMSWLFAALFLWDAIFHEQRRIAFQCREDKSATKLVRRARFIFGQLVRRGFPNLPKPRMVAGMIGTDSTLETIDQKTRQIISAIYAVPKGADVFRSEVFSGVLADELPHQDFGQESYDAASPSTQKYVGVGTPSDTESFAYKVMFGIDMDTDEQVGERVVDSYDIPKKRYTEEQILKMSREQFMAVPIEELVACIPDMRYWEMKTGDAVVPVLMVLHGADPDKRPGTEKGDKWIAAEKAKTRTKSAWLREYRGKWDVHKGKPVVKNWDDTVFVKKHQAEYVPGQFVGTSIDFGTDVCVALLAQLFILPKFNFQQIRFFDEVVRFNSNTPALAEELRKRYRNRYEDAWDRKNLRVYPDPYQGNRHSSTTSDKRRDTDIKILRAAGFPIKVKGFGVVETLEFVETLFAMTSPLGDPAVLIHPRCEYLIECVEGGWQYRANFKGRKRGDVIEPNKWIHGGDACRYMAANMFDVPAIMKPKTSEIPITPIITKVRHPVTGTVIGYRRRKSRAVANW